MDKSGAEISECGLYRYHLWRIWEESLPVMVLVMQNPSTADARKDDPTIRKCVTIAKNNGFGGISVRNVFALRATDEKEVVKHPSPIGPMNEQCLLDCRNSFLLSRLVVAWGNRLGVHNIAYRIASNICVAQQAYCLGTNKNGDPKHPLFLRGDTKLFPWTAPEY